MCVVCCNQIFCLNTFNNVFKEGEEIINMVFRLVNKLYVRSRRRVMCYEYVKTESYDETHIMHNVFIKYRLQRCKTR